MPNLLRTILLACVMIFPLYPQAIGQTKKTEAASFELVIQNRKVFSFRASLGALTPGERRDLARNRLANLSMDELLEPVNYNHGTEGVLLDVGGHPLFSITPGDLDADIGQTLDSAAIRVQSMLRDALDAEASQRSIKNLIYGILKALGATAAFLAFLALLGQVARLCKHRITSLVMSRMPKVSVGRVSVLNPRRVSMGLGALIRAIHYMIAAFIAYLCITFILNCFPYTQPWAETLGSGLAALLLNMGRSVLHSVPGLFAIAVIIFATWGLTRLINSIFMAVERGESSLPWIYQEAAAPTRRIAIVVLWIFAIIMAYPHIPGNESIAFKSVSVFVGLLVSFGSAGVVNQAMNGLVIMYARTFKLGDYVRIGEVEGTVSELSMLSTKLHTLRQEEIIIPNSVVITQITYNYTRIAGDHGVGISTSVAVSYDTPWRQVHALLMMAAEKTQGLSRDPAPYVIQAALSGNCVDYTLVVHMTDAPNQRVFVKSDLHQNIQDAFNQYGVQLMSPTYIKSGTPAALPEERWYVEPAKKVSSK